MTLDECCKDLPGGDWRSIVIRKLVCELIQDENKEKILASWCDEGEASDDTESKLLYYIVTNKRFFEIRVEAGSFSYESYFLTLLKGFKEKVVPNDRNRCCFKKSAYFSDEDSYGGISSYTVKFSFSVAKEELDKATFCLSAPFFPSKPNHECIRFKKLRDFVRGFHKAVISL